MSCYAIDPAEARDARDAACHEYAKTLAAVEGIDYAEAYAIADAELLDEPLSKRERLLRLRAEDL